MIRLDGVTFRYREGAPAILSNLSLEIPEGRFLLIAGPSGCGKSTLLRTLNGLVPRFHGGILAGRIRVAGLDPTALGPRAMSATVGFVFQDPESQFVTDRVEDELAFAMENRGLSRDPMERAIGRVAGLLDLDPLLRRPISTLSGGERQRLAVASALTLDPPVLVLDEPTSQIDPAGARVLLRHLHRLNRETGLTVVLSEHRLERAALFADTVCLLPAADAAAVVGPPREVLAETSLAPPVARLASRLGKRPVPLSAEEARPWATSLEPVALRADTPTESSPPADEPPLLTLEDLAFSYPDHPDHPVLEGVDLEIRRGERVALMGANGSGKTTLLKNLVGLLRPGHGKVRLGGRELTGVPLTEITAEIGFVPQNPSRLLFSDTVAEEVLFTRKAHGLPTGDPIRLLDSLGIAGLAGAYPRDLSTGERQRVALAAILAAEPKLLLMDEPTRGLDADAKTALAELLEKLAEGGVAVLLATHDVELAARFAARVLILENGRLAADGPTEAVLAGDGPFSTQIGRLFAPLPLLTEEAVLANLALEGSR